jgi:hypothetical protein
MSKGRGARLARLATTTTALVLLSASAAAADPAQPPQDLAQVVENARLWALGIIAAVATLFLILGGCRYVIAGGDPGEVERAKLAIKSAMFGYALALLAPVLLTVLRGIVGG